MWFQNCSWCSHKSAFVIAVIFTVFFPPPCYLFTHLLQLIYLVDCDLLDASYFGQSNMTQGLLKQLLGRRIGGLLC